MWFKLSRVFKLFIRSFFEGFLRRGGGRFLRGFWGGVGGGGGDGGGGGGGFSGGGGDGGGGGC